jgi:hypothetical protein
MASLLYNDNLIVSYPVFDPATKTWMPKIQLTLTLDRTPSFQTKAVAGVDAAKAMIDSFDQPLGSRRVDIRTLGRFLR